MPPPPAKPAEPPPRRAFLARKGHRSNKVGCPSVKCCNWTASVETSNLPRPPSLVGWQLGSPYGMVLRFLRHYLLIEYKSPLDRLTIDDFDTARAYAMLCKRKYGVAQDSQIAVALLYSQVEPAFFATTRDNGYDFAEMETGIWACEQHPLRLYAIDLVAYGAQDPEHPINLFSKRYKTYRPTNRRWEGLLGRIQSLVRREMQTMQTRLRGQEELNQSVDEMIENFLRELPPEQLLRHIPEEKLAERLRDLPAEERLRGLPAEERLRGLQPADLRHLSTEERQRLRELLDLADPKT